MIIIIDWLLGTWYDDNDNHSQQRRILLTIENDYHLRSIC